MFRSAIDKAQHAVEDVAVEAALGLTSILLACGAFLFAAGGVAIWLSTIMPVHFALMAVAGGVAACALIIFLFSQRSPDESKKPPKEEGFAGLTSLAKSVSSMGVPLDVVASGLFARQFKKAPVSTVAATAAVGALIGILADLESDER
ncbi:MAG: hypothetical protein AAGD92_06605 [Pseudomonadota bacterium]